MTAPVRMYARRRVLLREIVAAGNARRLPLPRPAHDLEWARRRGWLDGDEPTAKTRALVAEDLAAIEEALRRSR